MDDNTDSLLDNFHIVLVEPAYNLNIGATARAMMNLGFRHLHLVAPVNYEPEQARITALSAEPLLESMSTHATLADAVGEMEEVVGLALQRGKHPSYFVTLPQWAEKLPERAVHKTALVFGPEDNGLRQEHLNLCRWVIRIPSTRAFTSFNLAQSVLLVLYEIAKALPEEGFRESLPPTRWATRRDHILLDRVVESVMQQTGFFLRGPQPPASQAIHNLLGRLELTTQEVGILLSLFGRVDTVLRGKAISPTAEEETET